MYSIVARLSSGTHIHNLLHFKFLETKAAFPTIIRQHGFIQIETLRLTKFQPHFKAMWESSLSSKSIDMYHWEYSIRRARNFQAHGMFTTCFCKWNRSLPHMRQLTGISICYSIQIKPYLWPSFDTMRIWIRIMSFSSILYCGFESIIHCRSCTLILALYMIPPLHSSTSRRLVLSNGRIDSNVEWDLIHEADKMEYHGRDFKMWWVETSISLHIHPNPSGPHPLHTFSVDESNFVPFVLPFRWLKVDML